MFRYLLENFASDKNYFLDVPTYNFLAQKIDDLKNFLSAGCTRALQKGTSTDLFSVA